LAGSYCTRVLCNNPASSSGDKLCTGCIGQNYGGFSALLQAIFACQKGIGILKKKARNQCGLFKHGSFGKLLAMDFIKSI
jgi:hypothetical protein